MNSNPLSFMPVKQLSSQPTKTSNDQALWQAIPESAQDQISGGGGFDAYTKVVSQSTILIFSRPLKV